MSESSTSQAPAARLGSRLFKLLASGAKRLGKIQAWILLTVFYFLFLAPAAIIFRLVADPLRLRRRDGSPWHLRVQPADLQRWIKAQF